MTNEELLKRLDQEIDLLHNPRGAIKPIVALLMDCRAAIRALPLPAPEVPDKFAAFGRMVFDAAAGRFADGTMDETDHDNMELAVKAGLAEHVRYDPEKHGDVQDAEPGDKIVWWGAR